VQLSVLLPCCPALLYILLHILNGFIEEINDDDDDLLHDTNFTAVEVSK